MTTPVDPQTSRYGGLETLFHSIFTSVKYLLIFVIILNSKLDFKNGEITLTMSHLLVAQDSIVAEVARLRDLPT